MRIIGGERKGRRLFSPRGLSIRPTADRVREAVFDILGEIPEQARVLDLFAGTGAMGIEALSRGALSACFVDRQKASLDAVARNLRHCGLEDRSCILRLDVLRGLAPLRHAEPPFTLAFLDPPYRLGLVDPALAHLERSRCLSADAVVVAEHAPEEPISGERHRSFSLLDRRRYGKTLVSFMKYMI